MATSWARSTISEEGTNWARGRPAGAIPAARAATACVERAESLLEMARASARVVLATRAVADRYCIRAPWRSRAAGAGAGAGTGTGARGGRGEGTLSTG